MQKFNRSETISECDELIERYLSKAKNFIENSCFQYGKYNYMFSGEIDAGFIDDFQYFVFTKSTKTLISIKKLLEIGNIEDVLILTRTMFEGYILSRYVEETFENTTNENEEKSLLLSFVYFPRLKAHKKILYDWKTKKHYDISTNDFVSYIERKPSQMKLGKDKDYYSSLYGFFCDYAHCNFSILDCYLESGHYTYSKVVNECLARIIVLFVYTKLFESIVTVDGEDINTAEGGEFNTVDEEKECYDLVREVTLFLYEKLEHFAHHYSNVNSELNDYMQEMFKNMKESLKEKIGSVDKDFL